MMHKTRVYLADDHNIVRDGLALLIDAQSDMEIIGQSADGRTALQEVSDCQPDVVVMDLSMPNINGFQASLQMRQQCPNIAIVVLTRHSEPGYVRQLLQAGVRGYVLKQAAADDLLVAIRAVVSGGTYLDPSVARHLIPMSRSPQTQTDSPAPDLSERETEVVRMIALGHSNKEIASHLRLSVKTIDTYRARALDKLGLHSRAALVRYAMHQGWLNDL